MKSLRFSFAFDLHRSRCPRRIEILLLISALACYALYLAGLQARESGKAQQFRSNSAKHKTVLSLWRIGLEYLARYAQELTSRVLAEMEQLLRNEVYQQAQARE
ncbi:hypothetical protein AX279_11090 [Pseudomonas sp. J237]|nr:MULTISPECIES: hypothetical protein [Pseudomonas]OEO25958.1 hypothetical protein AX279_11090 [Pseudomonas sp. J237]